MLLFEHGGKKILYTGDWRTNGRKSEHGGFDRLLKKLPKVDVLITENTNAHRTGEQLSEAELVVKAAKIMKNCVTEDQKPAPVFVLCPTTNFDRIVSFIKAANTTKRQFWMDEYQEKLCKAASENIPTNTEIRVGGTYSSVYFVRQSTDALIKKIAQKLGGIMIYSMWDGYKKKADMKNFLDNVKSWGVDMESLHASGHADPQAIEQLMDRIQAKHVEYVHGEIIKGKIRSLKQRVRRQ
jgi:ribonuclease J